jgi:two-component system heavy metal sensor histidine kinase CusS
MKLPRIASMEIRLTLLLGVIALVVSSIAGYTLFWALKREVQRQEITEVAGKLELINHLIGMQTTLAQMQDLRSALDNIMVGHGNLKTWITLADGSVFYGEAPPVDVRPLSGREISCTRRTAGTCAGCACRWKARCCRGPSSPWPLTCALARSSCMPSPPRWS